MACHFGNIGGHVSAHALLLTPSLCSAQMQCDLCPAVETPHCIMRTSIVQCLKETLVPPLTDDTDCFLVTHTRHTQNLHHMRLLAFVLSVLHSSKLMQVMAHLHPGDTKAGVKLTVHVQCLLPARMHKCQEVPAAGHCLMSTLALTAWLKCTPRQTRWPTR